MKNQLNQLELIEIIDINSIEDDENHNQSNNIGNKDNKDLDINNINKINNNNIMTEYNKTEEICKNLDKKLNNNNKTKKTKNKSENKYPYGKKIEIILNIGSISRGDIINHMYIVDRKDDLIYIKVHFKRKNNGDLPRPKVYTNYQLQDQAPDSLFDFYESKFMPSRK